MNKYQLGDLLSWLKYLDDNYIQDDIADLISGLDINDEGEQKEIIRLVIKPEYKALNKVSAEGFDEVLNIAIEASEKQLEKIFSLMSYSFVGEVKNKSQFIRNIKLVMQQ